MTWNLSLAFAQTTVFYIIFLSHANDLRIYEIFQVLDLKKLTMKEAEFLDL